ncbi:Histidine kinase, partial [Globisporangium splendens]
MVHDKSADATTFATPPSNNNEEEEQQLQDADVDVDAEERLRSFTLGLKQRADQLMLAERFKDALPLYKDLLMHLTKSQVNLLRQRDLVISCRMNVLGAMSKLQQWAAILPEAAQTIAVIMQLHNEAKKLGGKPDEKRYDETTAASNQDDNGNNSPTKDRQQDIVLDSEALKCAFFFRGYAHFKLGSFAPAELDFRKAMELSPGDNSFREEWNELQAAIQCEKRVKDLMTASRQQFQVGKFKVSIDCSLEALRECHLLQRDEYTGLIHGNLAAAYTKVNDDAKAIEHYKRALAFARKVPNQTAAQKERIYDLLSALATCYSRHSDFSSAHSVILDTIKQLAECPSRRDAEPHLYLNAGRVCHTLGKFGNAELYLIKAESGAMKLNQINIALTSLLWLSKASKQLGKEESAVKVLDKALALAEKDAAHADMTDQLLFAKLGLLDPETNPKFKLIEYDSEASLWKALDYFEKKMHARGHLRASEVLVHTLKSLEQDDVVLNKLERVLFVVDRINIGSLTASKDDTAMLVKLVLCKVDFLIAKCQKRKAQTLLVKTLSNLPKTKDAHTQRLRGSALKRLAEIVDETLEVDALDGLQQHLSDALVFLRNDKEAVSSTLVLSSLLTKLAHTEARRGEIFKAQALLEESVALARRMKDTDTDQERLCGALIGLCVLQMKQQNMDKAQTIIEEIDSLPCAEMWKEMYVIKDQLRLAKEEEERQKRAVEDRKRHEELQVLLHQNSLASWWERWWFAVCVSLVGVAVAVLQMVGSSSD